MRADERSDDRSSALAIGALAVSLFVGTQVLARLSTGSPGVVESVVGAVISVILMYTVRDAVDRSTRYHRDSLVGAWSHRAASARKPLLIAASMTFAVIPRIELSSYPALGLPLRTTLGLLIALVVGKHANRWLLGISILTIVLHRWVHPTFVTVTFVGLIFVGFAMCTRADMAGDQRPPAGTAQAGASFPRIRPPRGIRLPVAIATGVAMSLLGGVLLSGQARQLAWKPDSRSRLGGGLRSSTTDGQPQQRFSALSAQDQLSLSYRPTRSTQVVMTLYTDEPMPVFLRAQTFDRWNGRTWSNGRVVPFDRRLQAGSWLVRPAYLDALTSYMNDHADPLSARDPADANGAADRMIIEAAVRFTGYTPVPVEPIAIITDVDLPAARWRSDGTVTPTDEQGSGLYVVLHQPATPGAFDLARADLLDTTGVSGRVKALAAEIAGDAPSAEARAAAISRWVTANIRYDLAARKPPSGTDPIEHILFGSRAGSCTQFATVTTALLRSAGIPARVATGFVGQTQVLPRQIQVQAKDAHAWAEVPQISGQWRAFDTTLGSVEVVPAGRTFRWWLVPAILPAAALAVAVYMLRRRRPTAQSDPQRLWNDLLDIGDSVGLRPVAPLSYLGFARQLDSALALDGRLTPVGDRLDRMAFGPDHAPPTTAEDGDTAAALLTARRVARVLAEQRREQRRGNRLCRNRRTTVARRSPD